MKKNEAELNSENKDTSLDEDFETLQSILDELSKDDIGIEEAFTRYSEGMNLLKNCNSKIDRIEKKVLEISENMSLKEFE
ncbi:MAG: exodeoxyribonuclease VII small subunit [Lachnospiraceae bacterium]|nr:exodeoxyribonuclease VII small subunit [Lachnospiraceae bacterium]